MKEIYTKESTIFAENVFYTFNGISRDHLKIEAKPAVFIHRSKNPRKINEMEKEVKISISDEVKTSLLRKGDLFGIADFEVTVIFREKMDLRKVSGNDKWDNYFNLMNNRYPENPESEYNKTIDERIKRFSDSIEEKIIRFNNSTKKQIENEIENACYNNYIDKNDDIKELQDKEKELIEEIKKLKKEKDDLCKKIDQKRKHYLITECEKEGGKNTELIEMIKQVSFSHTGFIEFS